MTDGRDVQPADFETADYRIVLRRLASLDEEAAGLRGEAARWFDERATAADDAVRKAGEQLAEARRSVKEAQRGLERVDVRAAQLWSDAVHHIRGAERYGRTVPQPAIPRQRGERTADDYLDEVATKVKYTAPPRPLNFGVKLLFGVFGVAGGIAGVLAWRLLRAVGDPGTAGTWRDAMPVVALVALLACPVLALVAAKRVADRRQTSLDTTTVATVLITGLVTAGALLAALGLTH